MPEAVKRFTLRRRESEREGTRRVLMEGLSQTRALIAQAYQGFNDARDPDLIESYVFEINALQSRYTYLLRQVKELEGEQTVRTG